MKTIEFTRYGILAAVIRQAIEDHKARANRMNRVRAARMQGV